MILWIIILFAVLAAFLLRDRSFYANWTTLFNTLISIYLSIMTTPYIIDLLPHGTKWPAYHCAGFAFLIALALFVILEIIAAYVIVVEDIDISFPKLFDIALSKVLGFLSGFCITGFVIFLLTTMVMQYNYSPWMSFIRTEDKPVHAVTVTLERACGFVHSASMQLYDESPANVMSKMASLKTRKKQKVETEDVLE